jgi:hypothetical protein
VEKIKCDSREDDIRVRVILLTLLKSLLKHLLPLQNISPIHPFLQNICVELDEQTCASVFYAVNPVRLTRHQRRCLDVQF